MKLERNLEAEVTGEVVSVDGVLVLRRIQVVYDLEVGAEARATVERVHGWHARFCPVARSLEGSIEISTSLRYL